MSGNPLVSVVIPCFNHEQYIEETILSVAASSYAPVEIIVINDGSSDSSENIVKKLQSQIPNLFYYSWDNAGPAAARNMGIHRAKGEYILPLDADDLISPDYIPKAVGKINNSPHVKLVYCEAQFFGEKSGKWNLKPYSPKLLARENMIFCSALYRKSDWEKTGGYDERMTWGWEDWEFWISLLKEGGEVVKLPITGFYYRVRKGSRRKSTNRAAKQKTVNLINEKHLEFEKKYLRGPLRFNRSWSVVINTFASFFNRSTT